MKKSTTKINTGKIPSLRLTVITLVVLPFSLWAQLTTVPIQPASTGAKHTARTQSLPAMNLPFWDDFSAPAATDTLWENYSTVWINSDLGINPPSVNAASFDGLNDQGIPYNQTDPQAFGFTDSLVSRKIKMTDVPLALRNTVFISFFYQWGGLGDPPDPNDFLLLEFKTNTGEWETMATLTSTGVQPNVFYDTLLRINQSRFYHDNFQFRFRSFGRKSGRYDTWHIDYVYINVNRADSDIFYPDRAVFKHIGSALDSYYAMPYSHFTDPVTNPPFTNPAVGLYNLSANLQPMNFDSFFNLEVYENGLPSMTSGMLNDSVPSSLASLERKFFTLPSLPAKLLFPASADSARLKIYLRVNTRDTLVAKPDFQLNDSSFAYYTFTNFYAYDDGSAEYAAGLTQPGNMAAYRFLLKSSYSDTLNGGYIHYPFTGWPSPNIVTLMVWANKNGKPGTLLTEQTIPVKREAFSKFTAFTLNPAVAVKDTVFIGWRQGPSGLVRIGLDTSHDTGNRIFVNTTGTWVVNDLVQGSLMIRPRFGSGDIVTGIQEPPVPKIDLYPNPNYGEFYLKGDVSAVEVFSVTGQRIGAHIRQLDSETWVQAAVPAPGIYLVRYRSGHSIQVQKVMISR